MSNEQKIEEFIQALRNRAEYWGRNMGAMSPTDFAHAVTFTVLNVIDGSSGDGCYDLAKEGEEPFNRNTYLHESYYPQKAATSDTTEEEGV